MSELIEKIYDHILDQIVTKQSLYHPTLYGEEIDYNDAKTMIVLVYEFGKQKGRESAEADYKRLMEL